MLAWPGGTLAKRKTDQHQNSGPGYKSSQVNEAQILAIFAQSSVGMSIRYNGPRKFICNPATEQMLGYSCEELDDISITTIIHPDDREPNETLHNRLRKGEINTYKNIRRLRCKDEHYIWVINEAFAFYNDAGALNFILYTNQDITALKQAEEEAEQKTILMETTIETMAQAYMVCGADMKIVRYNAQFEELFSFPPGFLCPGMPFKETVDFRAKRGDYNERYADQTGDLDGIIMRRLNESSIKTERSAEHTLPTGRRYIHHRKSMPDGGCVTTYTDITKFKNTEREAAEKSAMLEAIFDNMAQGVAVYDANNKLTAFNNQFPKISGIPENLMCVGMDREEILTYRTTHGLSNRENPQTQLTDRSHRIQEYSFADGTTYIYERIPTNDGGNILTATDITELKATEERLNQAQKMEAVGQLTGGIAHDFNNILAIIVGNLELCQEIMLADPKSTVIPDRMEAIAQASKRGAELTQRLLAFSRRQSLQPQTINVGQSIADMADLIRRTLGETIDVRISAVPDLSECTIDPGQFENALLNLSINARDAMGDGGTLTITTSNTYLHATDVDDVEETPPGDYVMIRIADTGVGIPPDIIEHVIEPFFTTKEVGKGSGLGLSMVYGFIRQSFGRMTLESPPGKGTIITLYVPSMSEQPEVNEETGTSTSTPALPTSRGESILVAEDDPHVQQMTINMLESLGYKTTTANDGLEAIKCLETGPAPDLLFTDVVLPKGINGIEVAKHARRLLPEIKVLYTSGYPEGMNPVEDTVQPGITFLPKPYLRQDLARTLRALLD